MSAKIILLLLHLLGIDLQHAGDLTAFIVGTLIVFGSITAALLWIIVKYEEQKEKSEEFIDKTSELYTQRKKPSKFGCLIMIIVAIVIIYASMLISSTLMK